jgi:soluble cytochrome b562
MPIPAALLAAMPLIGGVISGASQGSMNRKNRKFQEHTNIDNRNFQREMTDKERAWNVEDRDFNNAYNTPAQQMQRYKEAGLNPNLIYGQGTPAISEAPRGTTTHASDQQAPRIDNNFMVPIMQGFMDMIKTNNLKAQTDLLEKQQQLAQSNINLNEVKTSAEQWQMDRSRDFSSLDKELLQAAITNKNANTEAQVANAQFTLDSNQRAERLLRANLSKNKEEILNYQLNREMTRKQLDQLDVLIENGKLDQKLKEFEVQLSKSGLSKSDPAYAKILAEFWKNLLN